jgi:hypothetical protein
MPFIINNIDTLFTVAEVTVKVLKFAAKVAHYLALFIGAALILTGCWLVSTANHFAGRTQTATDVATAEHGPVEVEYAPAPTIAPESYVAAVPAIYSLDFANEWVLEDATAPIVPVKAARKRRTKKPVKTAA